MVYTPACKHTRAPSFIYACMDWTLPFRSTIAVILHNVQIFELEIVFLLLLFFHFLHTIKFLSSELVCLLLCTGGDIFALAFLNHVLGKEG